MVRQLAWSCALLTFAACATTSQSPSGDRPDGEGASTVRDARGNSRVPDDRQPTQEELLEAFTAPEPSRREDELTGSGTVPSAHGPQDPLAERRASFPAREAELKRLIAASDPSAARVAADLEREAEALGPAFVTRALELRYSVARQAGDDQEAQLVGRKWLLSCGPAQPDRCRREAFGALSRVLAKARQSRARLALEDAKRADACLRQVEAASWKKGVPLPSCADEALRTYRNQGDRLQVIRLHAARGRIAAQDEQTQRAAERELSRAANECGEPRCAEVRQKALERLAYLQLRQDDAEGAARAALKAVELHAAAMSPSERPWAWTDVAQKACAVYDGKVGPGACRRLEQSVVGFHSFRDYSRQKESGEGLSMDLVREVNAHYQVSLTGCLAEEAARLRPPAQERYTVRWVVLNDGRVGEMHMDRRDHENGPLAQCLRQRLALWRYPRYEGEFQHVEQTFAVSAARRR